MNMEKWKTIEEFPKYEISTYGRVRNVVNKKYLYIKRHTHGYSQIVVQKNNKKYYLYVHRLVASAFIPNPNNFPVINHKDEDKANNHVENLEWCTIKYNSNYGSSKERIGKAHHKRVRQYTKDGLFIKEWECYEEAEEELGLSKGLISKYVNSPFHWVGVEK